MLRPILACVLVLAPVALAQEPAPPPKPAPPKPAAEGAETGWTGVLSEEEFRKLHELSKRDAPPLAGEMIEVGGERAYLSLPTKGEPPFPAVLVIHEWWGLNQHIEHWADRLAADGYAALAVDLYGGEVATDPEEASQLMRGVDQEKALATMRAGHRFLAEDPRVQASMRAVIGWCFGGGQALRLAMAAPDLDAAVIYYGRLVTDPEQLAPIEARVLGIFGNQDTGIPPKSVDAFAAAMQEADRQLRILRYDAAHAFANPSGARYDEKAAAAAWKEVRRFLADVRKETAKEHGEAKGEAGKKPRPDGGR